MPDEGPRGCYDVVHVGDRVRNRDGCVREVVGKTTESIGVAGTYGRGKYVCYMLRLHDPDEPRHDNDIWTQACGWEVDHG